MTLRRLNRLVCLATMLALPGITSVHGDDSQTVAQNLGTVIGSEEACGLTYDQTAIERFINEHVEANDMSFLSTLSLMTRGIKYEIKDMSKKLFDCPLRSGTSDCGKIRLCKIGGLIASSERLPGGVADDEGLDVLSVEAQPPSN